MRTRRVYAAGAAAAVVVIGLTGLSAAGAADGEGDGRNSPFSERLSGYEEDPLVLSTTGTSNAGVLISRPWHIARLPALPSVTHATAGPYSRAMAASADPVSLCPVSRSGNPSEATITSM